MPKGYSIPSCVPSQAIFQLYIFPVAASTHVRSAQIENKFAPYSGGDVTVHSSIFSKIRDEKVKTYMHVLHYSMFSQNFHHPHKVTSLLFFLLAQESIYIIWIEC